MNTLCGTPYQGQPLDQEVSFRLLELQPGQPGTTIVVRLLTFDLPDAPSYEALSYTWGDIADVEEIEVVTTTAEVSRSAALKVTTSCAAALRRLRFSTSPRTLWIDFICINQSDVLERNHQLGLMPRIYNGASRVVIYLGESSEADSSDEVMLWLQDLHSPSESADTAPPIPPTNTIMAFLNRRWFTRVWVMQEVQLAKEATVVCGEKEVTWDAFRLLGDRFNNRSREDPLPYTVRSLVSRGVNHYSWRPSYRTRLLTMLQKTREFGATDPRDKLYAILPLLDWESQQYLQCKPGKLSETAEEAGFMVPKGGEYSCSTAQLFTSLAQDLIGSVGLDVLDTVMLPAEVPDLPTWATDWSTAGIRQFRGRDRHGSRFRHHGGDHSPSPAGLYRFSSYRTPEGKNNTQVHIRTAPIGTIVKLGELCDIYNDIFPLEQWRSLCDPIHIDNVWPTGEPGFSSRKEKRYMYYASQTDLSPFVRVLFGPKIIYPEAVLRAVKEINKFNSTEHSPADTGSMKALFYGMPASYESQAEMIFYNCHGRRFFLTDQGQFGFAPTSSSIGDQVVGIAGASMPFVTRSMGDNSGVVALIGSCLPLELLESQGEHKDMIIR